MQASMTKPKRGLTMIHSVETCACPHCHGAIDRGSTRKEFPRVGAFTPTERVTYAWCDFCELLFAEKQILHGGTWESSDGLAVVENERERARILRRIEKAHGDRRIVPATTG